MYLQAIFSELPALRRKGIVKIGPKRQIASFRQVTFIRRSPHVVLRLSWGSPRSKPNDEGLDMLAMLRRLFTPNRTCRYCGKRVPRRLKSDFCSTECWGRWEFMKVY